MFVRNHMEVDPATVGPETLLGCAMDLMDARQTRFLAVVNDAGNLEGVLTDREVWWTICNLGEAALSRAVATVMDLSPKTVGPAAHLDEALLLFCEDDAPDALAVVENRTLAGVLTRGRILGVIARVFGAGRLGSRIDVALLNGKEDLASAFEVLRDCQAELICATAGRVRDDGADPVLSIRLAQADGQGVERALARAGLLLLVPEGEPIERSNGNGHSGNGHGQHTPAVGFPPTR